jgi:DNA polymerase-3 subunit gamma/tau
MNQALHLKYRPPTLAELVGQPLIQTTLINAITSQQIAPAYLFAGPRGTGKTSTARILAKSLNCLNSSNPTPTPCGQCQSCRSIEKSSSLDVSEIDAASHNGVDDARSLIEHSSFAPTLCRYRIFILDEVHCLSDRAFNALLKLIEEPPPRVIFIFCTTEAHKVLPTIASRCQTFNFKSLSLSTLVGHLRHVAEIESIELTEEALNAIARTVNGGLRDALQLLSQLRLLDETITPVRVIEASNGIHPEELVNLLVNLVKGDTIEILKLARNLIDAGKAPQLILSSLLQVYRDLLLVKSTPKCYELIVGAIDYKILRQVASVTDFEVLMAAFTQLQKSEAQLKTSINAAIWLEVCLLNLISNTTSAQPKLNRSPFEFDVPRANGNPQSTKKRARHEDLTSMWASVVETAKPANRGLLSHASLSALTQNQAVLTVEAQYVQKFARNSQTLERLIGKALGCSVTVKIQQKTS